MPPFAAGRVTAFLAVLFALLAPSVVHAQQDGPRGYLLSPEGVRGAILTGAYISANQTTDNAVVIVDSRVKSVVLAPQYAQPFTVAGNFASVFVAQPVGTVHGTVNIGTQTFSNTSGGLGDFVFGGMLGLVGMPSLSMQSYLAYKPGFSMAAVATGMAPIGDYDRRHIFNLGTNRWAFRAALPMTYAVGQSFADPSLMTFELMPTVTFFTTNNAPFGALWQTQDPLFMLEGHITRNLNSAVWVSADAAYFYGARTYTNGISDNNTRMSVNLAGTVGVSLNPAWQLRASYAHSVIHNEYGMQGQGVRLMLVGGF